MTAQSSLVDRVGVHDSHRPQHTDGGTGHSHYGLALAVVVCGVLIAAVDTTIVVLALPKIEADLHVNVTDVVWVILSYLLVVTVLSTQVGRLGDMFGRVRMYQTGFAIFVAGSLLCGLASNELTMILFRILQGIGGALISANSGAVIADIVPVERRGRAYGFNAIGWNLGAILGILLGGAITTFTTWRWIFFINVPIGLLALGVSLKVLHSTAERRSHRVDWAGTVTLSLGLFCILWAATQFATNPFDLQIGALFLAGLVLLAGFAVMETRHPEPLVSMSLFRIPTMLPALSAAFLQSLANFAVLFLVIMYLQGVRQLTPLNASILLVPGYLMGAVVGPFAGRLSDRVGAVFPATFGLVVQAVALFIYAQLGTSTWLGLIVVASVVNGIGSGCFFPSNNAAVMKASPGRSFGVASGMLRTFANVGMVFSFAMALVVAAHAIPRFIAFRIFVGSESLSHSLASSFATGLHSAFYASMVVMLLAAVMSAVRRRTARARTDAVS